MICPDYIDCTITSCTHKEPHDRCPQCKTGVEYRDGRHVDNHMNPKGCLRCVEHETLFLIDTFKEADFTL